MCFWVPRGKTRDQRITFEKEIILISGPTCASGRRKIKNGGKHERRKEETRGVNPGFPDFRSVERETDEENLGTTLFSWINFDLLHCFHYDVNPGLFSRI